MKGRLALLLLALSAAQPAPAAQPERANDPRVAEICDLIEANAREVGMEPAFFARLIWKESRFDEGARSPVGALGIAQFMPYTAKERGLGDPLDKREALRHSAGYLKDLRSELGSWGLAAAAYNGGINRVKRWMQSGGRLPFETEDYVLSITAQPASWFREEAGREAAVTPLVKDLDFASACRRLPILPTRAVFALAESAPLRPWGAQVAGHPNEAIAVRIYHRLQDQYPKVLGGITPILLRSRPISGPRRITAVRIGADSRREADSFCARYRSVGGSCVVVRN
ncbi:transglycosylase SLT domain-containing protein [Aureimonas jatrophae]|uniref:Sporulation related domain-containing protein n=1 Tax=Aureimonas jatrophae TaxID=1166073 RepID=A0A1H0HKZ6_9HYPH|nr:transglycosylase SLT domain-containing protein [Aureimonas jatrophae]MBB3950645.1 soluble lytic murein transglycosylase-like protein [Aureimonas jatrophae]SDO19845.1 Sporulation related domain-containing protein [Aureimonas jatrophae]